MMQTLTPPMIGASFTPADHADLERWHADACRWGMGVRIVPGVEGGDPDEMASVGTMGDAQWLVYRMAGSGKLRTDHTLDGKFMALADTIDEAREVIAAAWATKCHEGAEA